MDTPIEEPRTCRHAQCRIMYQYLKCRKCGKELKGDEIRWRDRYWEEREKEKHVLRQGIQERTTASEVFYKARERAQDEMSIMKECLHAMEVEDNHGR